MNGPASSSRKWIMVFGTRPEAIKMCPVAHALRALPDVALRICLTGQHPDLVAPVLNWSGLSADIQLDVMQPGQSLDGLFARLLTKLGRVFDAQQPHRIIVHGDTLSTLAASLAAYFRKIPVAHVEAGLRSGNIHHPWPEEVTRRAVATIADLHFAPTPDAAAALLAENVPPQAVHVTGNTVVDALVMTRDRLHEAREESPIEPLMAKFTGKRIIAVTAHRRENWGEGMAAIGKAIAAIAARPDIACIFPLHPNPVVRRAMEAQLEGLENVALVPPLDYPDFVGLLDRAALVLTDSGGVQEEAPALGKPVLVMRETTERPEGVAAGTARLVGTDAARIVSEISTLLDDADAYAAMSRAHNPYGDGRAAQRIAEILARAG